MYVLWFLLVMLVVAAWTYAIVDIIRRRHERSAGKIAAWVIAIFVFPIVGTIAYYLANSGGPSGAPRDPEVGGIP